MSEQTYSSSNAQVIRIAVVEDDAAFMSDLVAAIDAAPDMSLACKANTLAVALEFLNGPAADVLVVDLGLPDGSGIEAIRLASERWPHCAIMVSTAFADELHVIQSIEAGATGYLLKDSSPQKLTEDIRALHGGGSPISPLIARHVLQRFRQGAQAPASLPDAPEAPTPNVDLSSRELAVLGLITRGFTYDEIATELGISRNTVMTFVRRVYAKLQVKSKIEAINVARHRKLLGM